MGGLDKKSKMNNLFITLDSLNKLKSSIKIAH